MEHWSTGIQKKEQDDKIDMNHCIIAASRLA
jgi:hypothetical protein